MEVKLTLMEKEDMGSCTGCGQRRVYSYALIDAARRRDPQAIADNLAKMRQSLAEDARRMMGLQSKPEIDAPLMLRVKKPPGLQPRR